ncbi:MAG: PHP domain-containing protein [Propioniciclava sp.]
MSQPLDLSTDWHTHSTTSDGTATIAEMVEAAAARGVTRLHLTDHVRSSTTWLPDYVTAIASHRGRTDVELIAGVETKILDVSGSVDLPEDLGGVDIVTVSDHQFPTRRGPVTPAEMARRIAAGEAHVADVVGDLVLATTRAVFCHERVVVGHVFSVLPKAGIPLSEVTAEMLRNLAAAVRAAGAVIEVNERWRTPTFEQIRTLCSLGVELVPSSDAHTAAAVAAWDYVAEAAHEIAP